MRAKVAKMAAVLWWVSSWWPQAELMASFGEVADSA